MANGPFSGAFLPGLIEDDIDQGFSGFRVLPLENLLGDLDEKGVQLTLVPVAEDLGKLVRARIDGRLENGIGLADELHVTVLDSVVDHFHIMTGPVWSHVSAAWFSLGDRRQFSYRSEQSPATPP